MKKKKNLFGIFTAIALLWSVSAAAVDVTNVDFRAIFEGMQATGGDITLTEDVVFEFDPAGEKTYMLSSTPDNVININTGTYSIIARGINGAESTDDCMLIVGDNVNISGATVITGTNPDNGNPVYAGGVVMQAEGRAKIKVVGGSVTADGYGARAIFANQGWVIVEGGKVSVTSEGTSGNNPAAIAVANIMSVYVSGGEITADGTGVRALSCTGQANLFVSGGDIKATGTGGNPMAIYNDNLSSVITITGGTFEATGTATRTLRVNGTVSIKDATIRAGETVGNYALFSNGTCNITIQSGVTIEGTNAENTCTGICLESANAKVFLEAGAALANNASVPIGAVNAGAVIVDLDPSVTMSIVASPYDNDPHEFQGSYGDVTLTIDANGNITAPYMQIYYTTDGSTPTTASAYINSGGTIGISKKNTVIKALIGRSGYVYDLNPEQTWNYSVETEDATDLIFSVGTLQQLKDAYAASQAEGVTSTTITLSASITINENFTMTPTEECPVLINNNGNTLYTNGAVTVTFGGALTMEDNTGNTNGMLRQGGQSTFNITGGTYTLNANRPLIHVSTGAGVNVNTTVMNLSNANFIVNGSSNAARIINYVTSDGNAINITNCNFSISAGGIAFNLVGPQYINVENSSLTFVGDGNSQAFVQAPTNAVNRSDLTINGLDLTMVAGNVFTWGGNKNIHTIIKDLVLTGDATIAKPTGGTGGVREFYDFRAHEVFIPSTGLHTRSNSPGKLFITELLVTDVNGDPVDAALIHEPTKNHEIWYRVGSSSLRAEEAFSPHQGEEIEVNEGQPLHVYTKMGEYTSAEKIIDLSSFTPTNISIPSINRTKAYIADNTLYLPESGAVQVFNVGGQLLLNVLVTDATLDVSSLSRGIYIVKVGATTFKVVK